MLIILLRIYSRPQNFGTKTWLLLLYVHIHKDWPFFLHYMVNWNEWVEVIHQLQCFVAWFPTT